MSTRSLSPQSPEQVANLTESYFSRKAPEALRFPDLISVNSSGDIIYAWKVSVNVDVNRETGEAQIEVVKIISQYHVKSGESRTYEVDDELSLMELQQRCDFYVVTDYTVVLVTYDVEKCTLGQVVFQLRPKTHAAEWIATRTVTVALTHSPFIGVGQLQEGRVLITGSRSTTGELVARSFAADPHMLNVISDVDYSTQINNFCAFLRGAKEEREVFIGGVFVVGNFLFIMLRREDVMIMDEIGKIDLLTNVFSLCEVNKSSVAFSGHLTIRHLKQLTSRRSNVWMSFVAPDYDQLNTFYWNIRLRLVYANLLVLIFLLNATVKVRRLDNGFSLNVLVWCLEKVYGPTMMPRTAPDNRFYMYFFDLNEFRYVKAKYTPPKIHIEALHRAEFLTAFECDEEGGALVYDFATKSCTDISFNYFPKPTAPLRLSSMATHVAYRNYPSFEKSPLLRRMLGVTNWNWSI